MTFLELAADRYSVRSFSGHPIEQEEMGAMSEYDRDILWKIQIIGCDTLTVVKK